jgi:sec-independent protein translocase protein TatB
MFDLSFFKLVTLAVIALIVFGPNELPKIASQAGRMLRQLRRMADSATSDLRAGLGPEFQNFDLEDLNPKRFVQKHLLDDLETSFKAPLEATWRAPAAGAAGTAGGLATAPTVTQQLAPGEAPPYDIEAT